MIQCRRRAVLVLAVASVLGGVLVEQAAGAPTAYAARIAGAGFTVKLTQRNVFPASVSCQSSTSCIATRFSSGGLLRYDGKTWIPIQVYRNVALDHVRCLSSGACVAIGAHFSLTRRSATAPWVRTPVPMFRDIAPGPMIQDLSCARFTHCVAVGYWQPRNQRHSWPIAMEWDGSSWKRLPQPAGYTRYDRYEYTSVSCAARRCVLNAFTWLDESTTKAHPTFAVWHTGRPVFHRMRVPSTWHGVSIDTLSCFTGLHCVGIGQAYLSTRHEFSLYVGVTFNGSTWSRSTVPLPQPRDRSVDVDPTEVPAISCTSPSRCLLLGEYATTVFGPNHPVAARWNGRAWRLVPVAVRLADTSGLSCPSTRFCLATANTIDQGTSSGLTLTMP